MKNIASLQKILDKPQRVVITMHHHPDGDAIASSLAMTAWLEAKGHEVTTISPNKYPHFLSWLPGIKKIRILEDEKKAEIKKCIDEANTIFCLDFSPLHRCGDLAPMIQASQAKTVAIDHHPDEGEKLDLLICDTDAAATCSIIYNLINKLGEEKKITEEMATLLYVGILTDTSCFVNSNTTAATHRIVEHLLKKGVQPNDVYMSIYGQQSLDRLRFLAHAITYRLVVMPEHQTAYFVIPTSDFKRFRIRPGDKAGIVDYALSLAGISVAALIVEQKKGKHKYVTLSLRSLSNIAVNLLASKYFKGGGHKNAAGAISYANLDQVVTQFQEMVKKEFKVKPANGSQQQKHNMTTINR